MKPCEPSALLLGVALQVRTVGIDYLSIAALEEIVEAHVVLLGSVSVEVPVRPLGLFGHGEPWSNRRSMLLWGSCWPLCGLLLRGGGGGWCGTVVRSCR